MVPFINTEWPSICCCGRQLLAMPLGAHGRCQTPWEALSRRKRQPDCQTPSSNHQVKMAVTLSCFANSLCPRSLSILIQVVAWRLFGTKPLSEPMLTYCQLKFYSQASVKIRYKIRWFSAKVSYVEMPFAKCWPSYSSHDGSSLHG